MTFFPVLTPPLVHLLDAVGDAIFTLDAAGYFTYANSTAAAMINLTPAEVLGKHLERDFPDAFSRRWPGESRRALELQRPVEYDAFSPSMSTWVRVHIVPTPEGLAVQLRDVTFVRRTESLQQLTARLNQASTPRQVGRVLLEQAVASAGAYMGALAAPSADGTSLELQEDVGYTPELRQRFARFSVDLDIPPCDAVRRGRAIFVSGDEFDRLYPGSMGVRAQQTRSLAALPLTVEGKLWGVLALSFEEARRFYPAEQEFLLSLVEQCSQAVGRTEAEAGRRTSQAQLRVMLEAAGIGHWELDSRTQNTWRSARHDAIFGYPDGHPDWTYTSFIEHVLPEDRERIVQTYESALARGLPWDFECRVRRADGEVRWIWGHGLSLTVQDQSQGHMLGLVQDITGRKQVEEELRAQAEILATVNRIGQTLSAELELSALVQAVTDAGVELTGAQFGAFFYNTTDRNKETHTLYALSGVPREAFAGYPLPRTTAIFGPTFRGEGVIRVDDVTQDARYGQNAPHHGMPQGHLAVRSYLAVPVIARSGEVLGGLFFGHEEAGIFTERAENVTLGLAAQTAVALDNARLYQQLQDSHSELEGRVEERTEQLKAQATELQRSNQELEQFAYIASHDLQAPIRAVTSFAGLLESRYGSQLDQRGQKYLSQIVTSGLHMKRLVDDLLAFSRIHTTQHSLEPTDTQAVFKEVAGRLSEDGEMHAHQITSDPLPLVLADAPQLDQLLQNLMSNALKYRREDVVAHVHVSARRDGNMWRFAVQDNGIGIEPQYHSRIFEIFQRLHGQEQYQGTGIGLAVCKKIVERHGGRIWLESTFGQGTTFFFTLRAV
ncbi:GAF domain-containing protein [Deinococcus deserti]|uniref:histidine kinase n=1 Tax=Deinococcus deserti (strain DSM 17065 / CIP 109153 / LMG 22923 / VCD115) TaxID=546414 RepID=C1D395_DEIDV|nr:GAF domain-containing protein [Deinococcus deserti]ACO47884.1 putative histidine kinase, classic [Deinococcus deserti VCD115]